MGVMHEVRSSGCQLRGTGFGQLSSLERRFFSGGKQGAIGTGKHQYLASGDLYR